MKRVIFLLAIMTTIQFCTIELSEIDSTGDGNDDIIGGILNPKPEATSKQKVPKDAYLVQYYTSEDNSTPISSRIEQQIQHDFSSIINDDYKSEEIGARWIGDFNFKNEEYNFDVLADKAIKLYIDGEEVYDDDLSSGRKGKKKKKMRGKHRIVVEYNLTDSTAVDPIETTSPDPSDSVILIVPVIDSVALNQPIVEEEAETPTVEVEWSPVDTVTVEEPKLSEATDILTFTLPDQTEDAIIDTDNNTVVIEVARDTDLTDLKPTFTLSEGATSDPESATAGDYSSSVTITVTAEDGKTTQEWTVNVTKVKSNETDILAFTLPEQTGDAVIDSDKHTVTIEVAAVSDITDLSPTFTLSDGATSNPESETAGNYSNAVSITVTAEDGNTTQEWTVNVTKAKSQETDILSFTLPEQTGNAVINTSTHSIAIEVDSNTDLTDLSPVFTLSDGATSNPESGTAGDYSNSVTITVTAEDGTTTTQWTVNVSKAAAASECVTNGGRADDKGLKTWCWADVNIPASGSVDGSNLHIDSEGGTTTQIFNHGNQIRFDLQNTNKRVEIRTSPWRVDHPQGTEEWFGWSYTFGQDYIIDQNCEWLFWQVHHGVVGDSPHTEFLIGREDMYNGSNAGELIILNNANREHVRTRITPKAGETLNIVVHVVWGDANNGLLQVWVNDVSVYNRNVRTVYSHSPWAGNAKWGIYKWPWANGTNVQKSKNQGITHVETFMGPLRMITRKPGDADYMKDSYADVKPR